MPKEKRYIVRYGLEIPEERGTPRVFKFILVFLMLGGIVAGFIFFIRWISDDSIGYDEELTLIGTPVVTRTPRPTASPSPTPMPTPRMFMSDVLSDAYRRNASVVGLLYITDTSISEILYQGADNDYYLSHNASGQQDFAGEVFVDAAHPVHELRESANIVLYGTLDNMKFGELKNYSSESFFKSNRKLILETIYATYEFEIFAYYKPGSGDRAEDGEENAGGETEAFAFDRTDFEDKFDFEDFAIACKAKSAHESEYTPYKSDTILTLVAVPMGGGDAEIVVQAYFKKKIVD